VKHFEQVTHFQRANLSFATTMIHDLTFGS
jgi:hypothetical protein